MSENNIMDVFLAVKVDESESDDLAGLLDTLQRISALQSSFTAAGGIELNVDVNTKEIESKIDALTTLLEGDDDKGDSKTILAIKSNTDYIISRLWSVYSPQASESQMTERAMGLGESSEDIATKYIGRLKTDTVLINRWGTAEKGKQELTDIITAVADKIAKEIATGTTTQSTWRAARLLEGVISGREDVGGPSIDNLMKVLGGEVKYQKDITGLKRGEVSAQSGVTVGSQVGFYGMVNLKKLEDERLFEKIRGKEKVIFTDEERQKMIRATLKPGEVTEDELKELVNIIKDIDLKLKYIPAGQLMAPQLKKPFRKNIESTFSGKEARVYKAKYAKQITPDEIMQITKEMIEKYSLTPEIFKDELKEQLSIVYKDNPEYADKIVANFIQALDKAKASGEDLGAMEAFSIIQEWKTISVTMAHLKDTAKRYDEILDRIFPKSLIGEGGQGIPAQAFLTDEVKEAFKEAYKEKMEDTTRIALENISYKIEELKVIYEKGIIDKKDYTNQLGDLKDGIDEIIGEI